MGDPFTVTDHDDWAEIRAYETDNVLRDLNSSLDQLPQFNSQFDFSLINAGLVDSAVGSFNYAVKQAAARRIEQRIAIRRFWAAYANSLSKLEGITAALVRLGFLVDNRVGASMERGRLLAELTIGTRWQKIKAWLGLHSDAVDDFRISSEADMAMSVSFGGFGAAENAAARTTLYRAVSPGEFADAVGNQVLRPGPNSYATGKFFAENAADAAKWGKALEGPGNFRILQVEFESGAASQFMRWQRLDGIGPARFGTFEQMTPLKISPLGTP